MDYCLPCRRVLNGAVTCPECGAYDSTTAPPIDRSGGGAPTVDTVLPEILFSEGPSSFESPEPLRPPAPSADAPAARRHPQRLKKYGGRTLAAAALTMLGGLAAVSLLPEHSAGAPGAAASPERVSPDEPEAHVTKSPKATPERRATHPARGSVRDRSSGTTRRPSATATHRESAASPAPTATTSPPVRARPTPRPSHGRPSHSASPTPTTPTPSASPTGSVSTSPTGSPAPSTTGGPVTDTQRELTELLLPERHRSGAVGGMITGR